MSSSRDKYSPGMLINILRYCQKCIIFAVVVYFFFKFDLSHVRQFLPWLGAKRGDLKEEKNLLKRSGQHSDDHEETIKKSKVDDPPKTAIPSEKGPMIKPIKLAQPAPVSE